jgi:hypothetical protein
MTSEEVRALLAMHGPVRAQAESEWKGEFPLPAPVARFYGEVGPVDVRIKGYGDPYVLPALARLWEFQEGYRWNSIDRERLADWDDDWLVIADEGGNPFIFSRASSRVLFAMHGTGSWDLVELFDDIVSMAACLAILGRIVKTAGQHLTDENSYIQPLYKAAAHRDLAEALSSEAHAKHILRELGWEQ